jgi:hypothetical protein
MVRLEMKVGEYAVNALFETIEQCIAVAEAERLTTAGQRITGCRVFAYPGGHLLAERGEDGQWQRVLGA